jgi:hypothetical protein
MIGGEAIMELIGQFAIFRPDHEGLCRTRMGTPADRRTSPRLSRGRERSRLQDRNGLLTSAEHSWLSDRKPAPDIVS